MGSLTNLQQRLERLEVQLGAGTCSCARRGRSRLAVVHSEADAQEATHLFEACPALHVMEDDFLVVRIADPTERLHG